MRVLIISDVHGNPWALEAVERACRDFDFVVNTGDAVNYGPDPRAAYAVWEDGRIQLGRVEYPVKQAAEALQKIHLPSNLIDSLCRIPECGMA